MAKSIQSSEKAETGQPLPFWPLIEGFRRLPSRSEIELYEARASDSEERMWLDQLLAGQFAGVKLPRS